jgi:hypothetical protein
MTETLNTSGFLFEQTEVALALLTADFGDGYGAAALIGDATGLRTWSIRIEALPGVNDDVPGITDNLDYAIEYILREDGSFLLREDGSRFVREYGAGASSRAAYLWRFFLKSKRLGNEPFWLEAEDPETAPGSSFWSRSWTTNSLIKFSAASSFLRDCSFSSAE